jgi:adenine-specific DNA glycosylase
MNFPRKAKKAAARQELSIVVIVSRSVAGQKQFCLLQRPSTGLLANLLEFPSFKMTGNDNSKESETITKKVVGNLLKENFSIEATELKDLGEIVHQVRRTEI